MAKIQHFSDVTLFLRACRLAREQLLPMSCDTFLRNRLKLLETVGRGLGERRESSGLCSELEKNSPYVASWRHVHILD